MSFITPIKKWVCSGYFQAALLLLICIVVTWQTVSQDEIANFMIFKIAGDRFLAGEDMYYYIQHGIIWDKFLYSPAFSLLFRPYALCPISLGVFLWTLTGAALFFYALRKLPITDVQKAIVFGIALIDLVNSFQNLQTNALNTALMLLIFSTLHNNKPVWAGLFTALCLCIKIYPAATALLFLFYPGKIKFILSAIVFTVLIFILPFAFVPADQYTEALKHWYKTLSEDTDILAIWKSPSLIGINYTWFPQTLNHFYLQLGGLLLVFLPLIKLLGRQVDTRFILLYLSLIMIFVVIFNHATESPTYVIAITGAGIWYAVSPKKTFEHIILVLLFVSCILLPTDIYPKWLRVEYLAPLKIRVVVPTLIWLKILYDLLKYKPKPVAA